MITYQYAGNDDRSISVRSVLVDGPDLICAADRSCVVHATDGDGQDDCAQQTLPEDADPFFLEIEKEHQGNDTVSDGDDACCDDESRRVYKLVVFCTQIPAIMHSHDRQTSQDTRHNVECSSKIESIDAHLCDVESKAETDCWKDAGQEGVARTIGHLQPCLSIAENDGAVADEMHTPDTDETHRRGTSE